MGKLSIKNEMGKLSIKKSEWGKLSFKNEMRQLSIKNGMGKIAKFKAFQINSLSN